MNGLLDPRTQALLAASGGLLSASGPHGQPVNTGSAIGQGMLSGLGGYNRGLMLNQQYGMNDLQMQRMKQAEEQRLAQDRFMTQFERSLPEGERLKFRVAPSEYMKELNRKYTVGDHLVSGSGQLLFESPQRQQLVQVPTEQPGVTQPTWMRPGQPSGVPVGGLAKPDILNTEVQEARRSVAAAGAPQINVGTEKRYSEAFAGKVADADISMRDAAIKAPDLADRANRVREVLVSGKVITGAGADYRLALGKALNLVGATDAETVSNTESLATSLAQNTLDAIKASGLGAGSGFSNADRDFLEKAVGGKITLEAKTIEKLAELSHRAAAKPAERWNTRVRGIPASALEGTGIGTEPVIVPPLLTPKRKSDLLPSGRSRSEILKAYGL